MAAPVNDRLQSWKEIAKFLQCEARTAQRYELHRGLPVHRMPGGGVPQVFAYTNELQAWLDSNGRAPVPVEAASKFPWIWGIAIAGLALVGFTFFFYFRPVRVTLSTNPLRLPSSPGSKLVPLLSDGVFVYFQESHLGKLGISRIPLAGGAVLPMQLPLEKPDPGVVSADGRAMLLRSIQENKDGDEPLYRQPIPAAPPMRLGGIRAYDSAWMPDGRHIIFSNQRSVYEALNDGSAVRKLFDVPGRAYWFRWSPDQRRLRFSVYDSHSSAYSIWQTSSVDTPPSAVSFGLDPGTPQCCGTWAPDGATYYFQAAINGFFQVFAHSERNFPFLAARPAEQLTRGASNFRSPVPLPSGDRLLVLSQTEKAELSHYDSKMNRWLPLFDRIPVATVAFSKDAKFLAYTRLPDHSLWKCSLPNCTDSVSLIPSPTRVTMPRWSPDGTLIACMVRNTSGKWRASVVAATGSPILTALEDPLAEADPVWSPSGDRIAFGATPNLDSGTKASIHILDRRNKRTETVPGSQGLNSPAWSPDGKMLAATRADTREITLFEFAKGVWTRPLPGIRAGYLNWSANGERLFFLSGQLRQKQILMALDWRSGRAAPVADFSGLHRPVFTFGNWFGLGPGDSLLALRDLSTEEILSWPLKRE